MATPLSIAVEEAAESSMTLCRCGSLMRPEGTTADQYPGTVPNWGNDQCRICDYTAAGRDPEDRFMSRERAGYLDGLRADIEGDRRRRGIPSSGKAAGRTPIRELIARIEKGGADELQEA